MKLKRFYELAVKMGMQKDPRTKGELNNELKRARSEYRRLKGIDREIYDKERFKHPYADTRILCGSPEEEIKTIMVGIDMETPELLMADKLIERGLAIDLIMAHHPEGRALSSFYEVMHLQKSLLSRLGIKKEIATSLLDERIEEVSRSIAKTNHARSVDAAKLLNIAYMCVHTPADNHVTSFLQSLFDKKRPRKVRDVLNILKAIPEYRIGLKNGSGPGLIAGKQSNNAGKTFVDMTGGTEGSKKVFGRLSQAGIDTIVSMHLSEGHFKNAKAEHINIIIAGHIASDTLGLNLLLDSLERKEKEEFNIINSSGFVRIKRK